MAKTRVHTIKINTVNNTTKENHPQTPTAIHVNNKQNTTIKTNAVNNTKTTFTLTNGLVDKPLGSFRSYYGDGKENVTKQ